jgi:hypothetical protein
VIGKAGRSARATLVERTSRYTVPVALPTGHRDAATNCDALIAAVSGMPSQLVKTLTRDQGSEMAGHAAFTLATTGDQGGDAPGWADGLVHRRGAAVSTASGPGSAARRSARSSAHRRRPATSTPCRGRRWYGSIPAAPRLSSADAPEALPRPAWVSPTASWASARHSARSGSGADFHASSSTSWAWNGMPSSSSRWASTSASWGESGPMIGGRSTPREPYGNGRPSPSRGRALSGRPDSSRSRSSPIGRF